MVLSKHRGRKTQEKGHTIETVLFPVSLKSTLLQLLYFFAILNSFMKKKKTIVKLKKEVKKQQA